MKVVSLSESENLQKITARILKSQNDGLNDLIKITKEKHDLKIPKTFIIRIAIALLLNRVNSNDSEFDNLLREFHYI